MDNLKKEKEIDDRISHEMNASLKDRLAVLRAKKNVTAEPIVSSAQGESKDEPVVFSAFGENRASMGGSGTLGGKPEGATVSPIVPVQPEKETLIPEVESGEAKFGEGQSESPSGGEKIIDVDHREIVAENKSETDKHFSEKDRRLIALSQKLEEARKFYVEQDREMDKGALIWNRIIGKLKRLDSGTLKDSFDQSKMDYENALKNYKDAILKEEVEDGEDAKIVAEWLTKGEFLSLENEKLNSKVKEEKGWPEKITNGYLGMVDKYRKLSTVKKIAIGLGITTVGFGIGLTGGTLLAGGLLTSRQIFSMSVSSVGFKGMFDAIDKKSKESKGAKEAKNISDKVTEKTDDGKEVVDVEALLGKLDEKIAGINARMQQEKKNQRYRNWAAIGSSVALSYVARYFGEAAVEHSGVKEILKHVGEKLSDIPLRHGYSFREIVSAHHPGDQMLTHGELASEQEVMGVKGSVVDKSSVLSSDEVEKVAESLKQEEILKAKLTAEDLAKNAVEVKELAPLIVKPGSSLEGTIIQHLTTEKKMSLEEAGIKAHRMALKFLNNDQSATEHHIIHPDAKIILDASGEKIVSIDEFEAAPAAAVEDKVGLDFEKLVENSKTFPNVSENVSFDPSLESSGVESAVETGDFLDENASVLLENTNTSLAEWQTIPERGTDVEKYATLGGNFTKSLAKLIGGNYFEDWAAIKGSSMREALKGDGESSKRLSALLDRLLKAELPERDAESIRKFREIMKPNRRESVYSWTKRIAILVKHLKIKKI